MAASISNGRHFVDTPTSIDILMGKGKDCFNHEGNRRFRALIGACSQKYHSCKGRYGKRLVVSCVSRFLNQEQSRFLKFDKTKRAWFEAGSKEAKEKIGHAIRDNINFRIGIAVRNMGKDQSKEVEYEVVQSILASRQTDGMSEAFQADVAKLEVLLEACFEEDDLAVTKPKVKVQQCIQKRIQKRGSSSSGGGNKRGLSNSRGKPTKPRSRNSLGSVNYSSASDQSLNDESHQLEHSMSIESVSSSSSTSPTLPPIVDPSVPTMRAESKSGKVKPRSRAPVKKRYRGSNSGAAKLPQSVVPNENGRSKGINGAQTRDGSPSKPKAKPRTSPDRKMAGHLKHSMNEAVDILSTMRSK